MRHVMTLTNNDDLPLSLYIYNIQTSFKPYDSKGNAMSIIYGAMLLIVSCVCVWVYECVCLGWGWGGGGGGGGGGGVVGVVVGGGGHSYYTSQWTRIVFNYTCTNRKLHNHVITIEIQHLYGISFATKKHTRW